MDAGSRELDGGAFGDGPPPTPDERRQDRRRRRIRITVAAVALVALAIPGVAMLVNLAGSAGPGEGGVPRGGSGELAPSPGEDPSDEAEDPTGSGDGPDPDAAPPDAEVPDEDRIDIPDPGDFAGADAEQIRLLTDIDASERTMLAFQLAVGDAFAQVDPADPDAVFDVIADAAREGIDGLEILRARLSADLGHDAAGAVRDSYVVHLDSWVTYLSALETDPVLITGNMAEFTIPINATGDRFVRAVDDMLDGEVHDEVRRVAEEIVDRGFSGPEESQV